MLALLVFFGLNHHGKWIKNQGVINYRLILLFYR